MITNEELQALIEIINRIPVTKAEALWLQMILTRFAVAANPPKPVEQDKES